MKDTKRKTARKKTGTAGGRVRKNAPAAKKAESGEATAASLRAAEQVIAGAPIGIVVIDSRGHVVSINAAALEVFDLNRDSVITEGSDREPSNFLDLMPESEQPRWQYMISMALSTHDEYADSRFFHHTGYVEKVLATKIAPVPCSEIVSDHLIMTVEDITNAVLMEKYLILSEKLVAKGEMATSVAHELNDHLETAAQSARALKTETRGKLAKEAEEHCDLIAGSVDKIKSFVDNLIDFSKPHTEYINYDIKHLIEDLLFSLRIQPRFRQTHFTIDLASNIPNLEIDVGQIQQVLMNILNNAADAIEEKAIEFQGEGCELKREIEIRAAYDEPSETVMIAIADNGAGMTEETLSKVFEKHFSTKKSGHGLGLFNCRKIAEQHHGDIEAHSVYGEGSTFSVYLPRFQPRFESADSE